MRPEGSNTGAWTDGEINQLIYLVKNGSPLNEIAIWLNRSPHSVQIEIERLSLSSNTTGINLRSLSNRVGFEQ